MAGTYVVVHCRTPPFPTCVPVSPFTSVSLHPHSTKRRHTFSSECHISRFWGKVCLTHADLNLSLSLVRSCDSGGQGHDVIDQCRGGSHSVPRTTSLSVKVTSGVASHQCHTGCSVTARQCNMHGLHNTHSILSHCVEASHEHIFVAWTQLSLLRCIEAAGNAWWRL